MESSSTTSTLRSRARLTEARASKKSPARIAILLPYSLLMDGCPRRSSASSITSSWKSEAVWIISVISASRRCDGNGPGRACCGCPPFTATPPLPPRLRAASSAAAARATRSTMVGRIFLPPSCSKRYLAQAASTGWSLPSSALIPCASVRMSLATTCGFDLR